MRKSFFEDSTFNSQMDVLRMEDPICEEVESTELVFQNEKEAIQYLSDILNKKVIIK